jgi:hypothetical protein
VRLVFFFKFWKNPGQTLYVWHMCGNNMRALVLSGTSFGAWEAGARLGSAELKKAATHFDRSAALSHAPAV